MVDPSELISEGIGQPGLAGEKGEEPRIWTTEANSANARCESQTHLPLVVKKILESGHALDKPGQHGRDGMLEGGIAGSEEVRDIRAMIDAIDALIAMGAT